ncbi:TPR domain protein, putative component of TonB system [Methanosarcina siciliae T4/M]|uniref:TPR domain protein, putative component of TonB system n=1 Tax=Methanosarcina siciliae T4/M TaxID=1434120 RepID=A0A0E3P9L2_9EURY|nr:tetratricopeptide repeat protein [Methanosarcina siciliae]AKB30679.1 TPR domain protein, putative component of TonB system [Methanosarcina siciliae T4/M]
MERSKSNMSDRINCNSSIAVSTSISVSSNNPKGTTLYRYSPENVPPEILKNIFVGRDDIFEKTFKELETAGKNKTPRFYLIVGSRGIGKSHFLIMLYYRIKQELSFFYIPIKFAEEEYSVYRASDFFLRILQERNEDISDILSLRDEDEILDASLDRLKEIAKKENKTYLIFVENLHEVFRQFDVKEVQKLRSIFQKYDFFSIIASSPIIFPGVAESEEPFYNFFRIQHLREFTVDEIKILLKKIAEIEGNIEFLENFKKCEPRIEGITHLTGGSPRLVIFFYELITRENFEDLEKVFFKILDEHTPYYQEIFQLLTGQKRLIFDTVISSESPLTPKQIAEKSRIDASVVITQLRRLEKDRYVLSRPAGRETYYEVRERLFRLWRDMRQPLGRNRISVFMDFLKLWYTSNEQKKLFERKFHLLESGDKDVLKDLCYYIEVLSDKYKAETLLKLTPKIIELEEWEEADHDIQKLKEIANRNTDIDLKAKYLIFESLSNYKHDEIALETFKKALKFDPKDYSVLLDSSHITIYKELLRAFDKTLELNPEDEYALTRKGSALASLERYEEAIEVFNKVLDLNPENEFALSNKGYVLCSLERYEEAIKIFIKIKNITSDESLRIESILDLIEAYLSLDQIVGAITEIESIKSKIVDQTPRLIETFIEDCWEIIFEELRIGNLGSGRKFIRTIFDLEPQLEKEKFEASMINFFKNVVDSGELEILKISIGEILELKVDSYPELLKPLIKAVEIIETKDVRKYYKLQVEEREIVADIVQKISKSGDLLP